MGFRGSGMKHFYHGGRPRDFWGHDKNSDHVTKEGTMMDMRRRRGFRGGSQLLVTALFAILAFAIWAGDAPILTGHWEGAIALPNAPPSISADITVQNSVLSGTMSIPAQGAKDLPLANISLADAEASFELAAVPGQPRFKGALSGDKLAGEFTQNGQTFPFTLERKAAPAAAAKDALAEFDKEVTDALKALEVPGCAIAVVRGKEVVFAKGFGLRDVEMGLPVTADTLFPIGSSTKAFTTFLLGGLVEKV
jgi:hypothetical protein